MLIFGPGRCTQALDLSKNWIVMNLTSTYAHAGVQLQHLYPSPQLLCGGNINLFDPEMIKQLDMVYYQYVHENPYAFSELMYIMTNAVNDNVFICIADYNTEEYTSFINESLMKLIQSKYEYRFFIVNEPEDLQYINFDGCPFGSVEAIQHYDMDKNNWILNSEINRLSTGGNPYGPV